MKKYNFNKTIKSWAEDDRPREKFILKGRKALSDAELIAIQINSGSSKSTALDLAKEILSSADNKLSVLSKYSIEELTAFKGIGQAKAVSLLSALELANRKINSIDENIVKITESQSVYNYFKPYLASLDHEEFWVMFLNTSNRLIKIELISSGGIDSTVVDVRLILKRALLLNSSSIILAHNHPSGNAKPSQSDIKLTKQIADACASVNVSTLDHLIICDTKYFSFTDEGII